MINHCVWITNHIKSMWAGLKTAVLAAGSALTLTLAPAMTAGAVASSSGSHLVAFYDDGVEKTIITKGSTVADGLKDAELTVNDNDQISTGVATKLHGGTNVVNIKRARPVNITDSDGRRTRIVTAETDPGKITKQAGIAIQSNDKVSTTPIDDFVSSGGVGQEIYITRAKTVNIVLYGQPLTLRTLQPTIGKMLTEAKIKLATDDTTSLPLDTKITDDMSLQIWRNGVQTIEQTEDVPFETETVKDPTKVMGYHEVQTAGQNGKKTVIYQVNMQNGVEVGRQKMSEVVTVQPVKQIEAVGTKSNGNGLTKSKGTYNNTDSKGVTHRETFYDLNMTRVMTNCGAGGQYTIREDGVKVDPAGYVIIAANLNNYPRCSIVETSVGLGKVYDTGGFASVHPHGFDIATDWSNNDGR